MALIECEECSKEISDKAEVCPHCGAPTKYGGKSDKKKKIKSRSNIQAVGCLTIVISVILGLTIIGIPFAVFLGIVGVIILIIGFIPVA